MTLLCLYSFPMIYQTLECTTLRHTWCLSWDRNIKTKLFHHYYSKSKVLKIKANVSLLFLFAGLNSLASSLPVESSAYNARTATESPKTFIPLNCLALETNSRQYGAQEQDKLACHFPDVFS